MGVVVDISPALERIEKMKADIEQVMVSMLSQVGERAVEIAQTNHTYKDKTGNLTSSIGYGVYHKGELVASGGFEGTAEGALAGEEALQERSADVSADEYALVVVAGMHYALYVERKGYAVLDNARIQIESIAREVVATLEL